MNGGEEVDGEASLGLVVSIGGEDACEAFLEHRVFEALDDFLLAEGGHEFFEEDFDEDTGAGGCVFFVELDDLEDVPADTVRC